MAILGRRPPCSRGRSTPLLSNSNTRPMDSFHPERKDKQEEEEDEEDEDASTSSLDVSFLFLLGISRLVHHHRSCQWTQPLDAYFLMLAWAMAFHGGRPLLPSRGILPRCPARPLERAARATVAGRRQIIASNGRHSTVLCLFVPRCLEETKQEEGDVDETDAKEKESKKRTSCRQSSNKWPSFFWPLRP